MTTKWIEEDGELERLTAFCAGKSIEKIELFGSDDIVLMFLDGSSATISTLGGLEVGELSEAQRMT